MINQVVDLISSSIQGLLGSTGVESDILIGSYVQALYHDSK